LEAALEAGHLAGAADRIPGYDRHAHSLLARSGTFLGHGA